MTECAVMHAVGTAPAGSAVRIATGRTDAAVALR